jgi:hypothetical protein
VDNLGGGVVNFRGGHHQGIIKGMGASAFYFEVAAATAAKNK